MATDWASEVGNTLERDSWGECLDLLLSSGTEDTLYRGHRLFDWELQSSLERALEEHATKWDPDGRLLAMKSMVVDQPTKEWALDVESALTQRFRHHAIRLSLTDLPPAWDTLGWWEVMQHHGAPTRLLDWTNSFFVALWFAVSNHKDGEGDMALWIYDRRTVRVNLRKLMTQLKETEYYDQIDERQLQNRLLKLALKDGTDLLIPVTPRQFPRAVAQQSILTISPNVAVALPAGRWLRQRLTTCVRLREAWKPEIQTACVSIGLSRLNLFRDFDSLGNDVKESFISMKDIPDPF